MTRKRIGGKEPYARVYASAKDHPRHLAAGLEAEGLWKRAMAYCADHMTNGFVPKSWFEAQAPKRVIKAGSVAGLWELLDNGYLLHDYLDHNRSKEQVEENRAKELAKKKGKTPGNTSGLPPGNDQGNNGGNGHGNVVGIPSGVPRDSVTQLHSTRDRRG